MSLLTSINRHLIGVVLVALLSNSPPAAAENHPGALPPAAVKSEISTFHLPVTRVVWTQGNVSNPEGLVGPGLGQATLKPAKPPTVLDSSKGNASIVLDFGTQLAGSVELFTPMTDNKTPPKLRIRFGESVAETMADVGERGAQNDHALRDQTVSLPWLGKKTIGPSGFRFVRFDALDPTVPVRLTELRAAMQLRDIPYIGSFRSSDARLDQIWKTGAWTVHLNMQDYLWDGIKRDRLIWLGDMHPEVSVIGSVFGQNDVVSSSLDLIREITPPSEWMNGISSYSMWWVIIHEDWHQLHGDTVYLGKQKEYLKKLLPRLAGFVDENGKETLDGMRFLDWPTYEDKVAVHEGLQAMLLMTMDSGARLMDILGEKETATLCRDTATKLRRHNPPVSGRKSPAALCALAGLRKPGDVAPALIAGGPADLSTFYGYYVLRALGRAGETQTALDNIRQYWGGMLDFGATTFWEDFDLAWTKNAGRIDELVPAGKKDLHGDFGAHCYVGFRHSLCHGWAGGPTAFLSQHVLGIRPAEPGFAKVIIEPHLGDLTWAEGTYPTPKGIIRVRHDRQPDGSVKSRIDLPAGVERVSDPK